MSDADNEKNRAYSRKLFAEDFYALPPRLQAERRAYIARLLADEARSGRKSHSALWQLASEIGIQPGKSS